MNKHTYLTTVQDKNRIVIPYLYYRLMELKKGDTVEVTIKTVK